jgi:predicted ribosome quality control (RQC) complex YloA/Tae2 family protein
MTIKDLFILIGEKETMPLDGITVDFLSKELHGILAGARVEKIVQNNPFDLFFKLRSKGSSLYLVISANPSNPRIHLTQEKKNATAIPLRFCSILRKYLSNASILSIHSEKYERVIQIQFRVTNEMGDLSIKSLIVEIMGKHSNIIFVNNQNIILDSILHIDSQISSMREILPAGLYVSPPPQNKTEPTDIIGQLLNNQFFPDHYNGNIGKFLLDSIKGISPQFASSLCTSSCISDREPYNNLTNQSFNLLTMNIKETINRILANQYSPHIFFDQTNHQNPVDFHSFHLSHYKHALSTDTLSDAMDFYYQRKERINDWIQKKNNLIHSLQKEQTSLGRKISAQMIELDECQNAPLFKKYGDLILSYKYMIRPKQTTAVVSDYYTNPPVPFSIPLNPSFSASKNAEEYYKKYKKLQSRKTILSSRMESSQKKSNYLESIAISLDNAENKDDLDAIENEMTQKVLNQYQVNIHEKNSKQKLRKRNDKNGVIKFRKFVSSDGYEILIGRNNLQNDQLTLKIANKNDLWFHLQKAPGAHCVLRLKNNSSPSDLSLLQAAMLVAWYSKDRTKNTIHAGKINVDYCFIKDVRKPKGSPPGFVLYKNFSTLFVNATMPDDIQRES